MPNEDTSETIAFFDVSTPAATLNNNTGASAAIFADLGSGKNYGTFGVATYSFSSALTLAFALNADEIERGGWFAPEELTSWMSERPEDFARALPVIWKKLSYEKSFFGNA